MRALSAAALLLAAAAASAQEVIVDPLDKPSGSGPAPAPPPASTTVASLSGYAWSQLDVDTRLDNGREAAAELMSFVSLRLSVSPSPRTRAVATARLRRWSTVERNESHAPFLVVNGEGWRHGYELSLGDTFVELTPAAGLGLKIGLMTFAWGQTDLLSPADPLNPRDLRWGLPVEPGELPLPVLAAAAHATLGAARLELIWLPFFTPARGWLTGQDYALFSPGGSQLPVDVRGVLPDEQIDALQGALLDGFAPDAAARNGSLALRVSGRVAGVELAAGWLFGWDGVPEVKVDPLLGQLLVEAGTPSPRLLTIATLLQRLEPRILAGERLATGEHRRQHVLFGEAATALGPFVVKLDAGFAHEQTYYTTSSEEPLLAVRHPTLAVAAGVDYRFRDRFFASATWLAVKLFGAGPASEEPFVFAAPSLHVLSLLARAPIWRGHLDAQLLAIAGVTQGDLIVQPSLAWRLGPSISLVGGVSIWQGEGRSPGGFFDHTDAVFVRVRAGF